MRKGLPLAVLIIGLALLTADTLRKRSALASDPRVPAAGDADINAIWRRQASEPGTRVVFLGDSITQRWLYRPALWEKHFGRWHPANLGFGGESVQGLLWRLRSGVLDGTPAEAVVLLIGTNNIPYRAPGWRQGRNATPDEVAEGVRLVVVEIRKRTDARVLLLGVMPREMGGEPAKTFRTALNERLAKLCDGKSVRYADVGAGLEGMTVDGLHVNDAGYAVLGPAIEVELRKMLRE